MHLLLLKSKNIFFKSLSLLFLFVFTFLSQSEDALARPFQTGAKQAILMDFESGAVLFEKDSEERMGPSSMTKLMTAYIIFDSLKNEDFTLDSKFYVSEKAWKKGGSKMFVKEGSYIELEDLIKGIIIQSGNDACIVFAEGHSRSEEAFAEDMNYMAERLGLKDSHFENSTGWPAPEHYSTAKDLAKLSRRLIRDFPEYYHYFKEKEFTYSGITQKNRNSLLDKEGLGVDGLKTGHTEAAGYGIAVSAVQNGKRLIAVVNGLNSERRRISEAERLLRYGFLDFKSIDLYEANEVIEKVRVWAGEESYVPIAPDKNITMVTQRILDDRPDYKIEVVYNEPVDAPVEKGTELGKLVIYGDGKAQSEYQLYATKSVKKAGFFRRVYDKLLHLAGI
jgi:D-alanyl-D-alanine carboxypeptidase (penicillin-binding protein 5/6)